MSIQIASNFKLRSKVFLDDRQSFSSVADMKAFDESAVVDGFETLVAGQKYVFNSSNTVDATTGKWRAGSLR